MDSKTPELHTCVDDGTLVAGCAGCDRAKKNPCSYCGYGHVFKTHNPDPHYEGGDPTMPEDERELSDAWFNEPQSPTDRPVSTVEKCKHCHLFIEENLDFEDSTPEMPYAEYLHSHRGDDADEALDETHDAEPSGMLASLDVWRTYGPPAMRHRFIDGDDDDPEPDIIGSLLLAGATWESINADPVQSYLLRGYTGDDSAQQLTVALVRAEQAIYLARNGQ